ncbi:MAG: DNA alkylation repair protein [Planctomycetes bacterium]|nr:DNA alkylation repair protein [Planctomycetota bacterium]
MATTRRSKSPAKPRRAAELQGTVAERVAIALAELERAGNPKTLADYGPRYGIATTKAFGVPMGRIHALAKRLGRDHALAHALWKTGWYEARLLTAFVAEKERVTPAEMDRWTRGFDNWAVCDTLCFHLFDRTPHAFGRVAAWAKRSKEFEKRAAFALLASLALHDKETDDAPFLRCLPLAERAAADERNFVKKSVSWALRGMGTRSRALHAACTALAERLAESDTTPERWIGKDVLRDLNRPLVKQRAEKRERRRGA